MTRKEAKIGNIVMHGSSKARIAAFGTMGTVTIEYLDGTTGHRGEIKSEWQTKTGENIFHTRQDKYCYCYVQLGLLTKVASTKVEEPKVEERKRICKHDIGDVVTCRVEDVTYRGVVVGIRSCGLKFTLRLTHCSGVPRGLTGVIYRNNEFGVPIIVEADKTELYRDFGTDQVLNSGHTIPLSLLPKKQSEVPSTFAISNWNDTTTTQLAVGQYVNIVPMRDVWEIVSIEPNAYATVESYMPSTMEKVRRIELLSKLCPARLEGYYSHNKQLNRECYFSHNRKIVVNELPEFNLDMPNKITSKEYDFPTEKPRYMHNVARKADLSRADSYLSRAFELGFVPIDTSRPPRPQHLAGVDPIHSPEEKPEQIQLTPNKKQKTLPLVEEVPTFKLNFKPKNNKK